MKESDIRPEALMERYLALSAEDVRAFAGQGGRWEEVPCPGCGGEDASPAFDKQGFSYVTCPACGSLFVSPRPGRAQLDAFYRDAPSSVFWATEFFPAVMEARRGRIIQPRVRRVLERCDPSGTGVAGPFVDVGAGAGVFLEELTAARPGAEVAAVEPGEDLAEQARRRGLRVIARPAEACDELVGEGGVVTCFEVIEHVYDPLAFVRSLARLGRPGAQILVTGLGGDGFDVQVLWSQSRSVSPPHHLNFLSVDGFERLFERAGLDHVEIETPGELDVELARKGLASLGGTHRFIELLLERRDDTVLADFQRFLQRARLSSHVWAWARCPETM